MSDVEMKQYVDSLVDALRREMDQRQEMNSRAVETARSALEARLENMNEFRNQITDERGSYVRLETFQWVIGAVVITLLGTIGALVFRIVTHP